MITDRVRPGNCFAPFHWSDMFGPDVAINAVTNDAVDPASLRRVQGQCCGAREGADAARRAGNRSDARCRFPSLAVALGLSTAPAPPELSEVEQAYVAGVLTGLQSDESVVGVPVLPAQAPLSTQHRAWVDGVLAGAFSRVAGTTGEQRPATEGADEPRCVGADGRGAVGIADRHGRGLRPDRGGFAGGDRSHRGPHGRSTTRVSML